MYVYSFSPSEKGEFRRKKGAIVSAVSAPACYYHFLFFPQLFPFFWWGAVFTFYCECVRLQRSTAALDMLVHRCPSCLLADQCRPARSGFERLLFLQLLWLVIVTLGEAGRITCESVIWWAVDSLSACVRFLHPRRAESVCIRRLLRTLNASWCSFQGPLQVFKILRTHQTRLFCLCAANSARRHSDSSFCAGVLHSRQSFCLSGHSQVHCGFKGCGWEHCLVSHSRSIDQQIHLFAHYPTNKYSNLTEICVWACVIFTTHHWTGM